MWLLFRIWTKILVGRWTWRKKGSDRRICILLFYPPPPPRSFLNFFVFAFSIRLNNSMRTAMYATQNKRVRDHSCPIHSKCVASSLCIDRSSWQKSCREIHEVILTGGWQTLQEVWLQSPEMVLLREWGVKMSDHSPFLGTESSFYRRSKINK